MIVPSMACLASGIAVLVLASAMVPGAENALPDLGLDPTSSSGQFSGTTKCQMQASQCEPN
jgi:hypothetical protein